MPWSVPPEDAPPGEDMAIGSVTIAGAPIIPLTNARTNSTNQSRPRLPDISTSDLGTHDTVAVLQAEYQRFM